MSGDETVLELTVRDAEKRDAGRGVARLPEAARQSLGVLSGDTVVVEGESATVAKVWPAGADVPPGTVRIDADTRANAGAAVGEPVVVRPESVAEAERVVLAAPAGLDEDDARAVEAAVARDLEDRPVSAGDRVRVARLGVGPFVVGETTPSGTVRITADTSVTVRESTGRAGSPGEAAGPGRATRVTYEDIGGLDEELEQVREMVELPLSEPELFRRLGIDPPKGVLLYGPPGTGKTLIARAVAGEVDAEFIHVSGPEIMSKYKGESEERIREVFERAEEAAPAVVFFDEIDSIAGEREDGDGVENRVVAQLLSLMDGLEARGDVVVIGATNRVDALDPALRRGGRFDREIEIGVPGEAGRREILAVHARGVPLADDVDLDRLAGRTHGFVGADVAALVTEAAMGALRRARRPDGGLEPPIGELRVTRADFEAALAAVDPSAMREFVAETPAVGFDDVGGLEGAKAALREAVEWPLAYAPLFEATDTEPPSGVLLYGPPGTGKTLLARALAGETDVNFVRVAGPELLDKYVGESERAVREVFERARHAAPAIVFFDEVDAIAGRRGGGHEVTERVVSQLLAELDGSADNPNLVVLAATNRKDAIDPALLRPGRIEQHVEVPAPDADARREILAVHTEGTPLADDVDLDALAAELAGFSGADVAALVREASMRAIREVAADAAPEEAAERAHEVVVGMDDLRAAAESVAPE